MPRKCMFLQYSKLFLLKIGFFLNVLLIDRGNLGNLLSLNIFFHFFSFVYFFSF